MLKSKTTSRGTIVSGQLDLAHSNYFDVYKERRDIITRYELKNICNVFSYDIVIIFSCKVGVLNLDSRRKVMVDLWISSLTSKMAHNNGSHTQTIAAITLIENYAFSCIGLPRRIWSTNSHSPIDWLSNVVL